MSMELTVSQSGLCFYVKVVPGSSRTKITGTLDGMLKIKVAAPPEKGKANRELIQCISDLFGIRRQQVTILAGTTNPVKQLQIEGVTIENARHILGAIS